MSRNGLDIIRRIAVVGIIVIFCGGAACQLHPTEIGYAPGYGYVVRVKQSKFGPNQPEFFSMYIFPTEERAKEFYAAYYSDPNWPDILQPGEREVDQENLEFYSILDLLRGQAPPPINEETAPLAIPDLPEPIPQTPL